MSLAGFAAGTLVKTMDGPRPIEDISVGDYVLSYPEDEIPPKRERREDEMSYKRVTATASYDNQPIRELNILHLANNLRDTMRVTGNYLIYDASNGRNKWINVEDMRFGKAVVAYNWGSLLLGKNRNKDGYLEVYNLEIEDFHTYYVGQLGVWVHDSLF